MDDTMNALMHRWAWMLIGAPGHQKRFNYRMGSFYLDWTQPKYRAPTPRNTLKRMDLRIPYQFSFDNTNPFLKAWNSVRKT